MFGHAKRSVLDPIPIDSSPHYQTGFAPGPGKPASHHHHSTTTKHQGTSHRTPTKVKSTHDETSTRGHLSTENSDYTATIIYSGSMFFWKDEVYTDIDIVEHPSIGYLEICAFDVEKCVESHRVYISLANMEAFAKSNHVVDSPLSDASNNSTIHSSPSKDSPLTGYGLNVSRIKLQPLDNRNYVLQQLLAKIQVHYTDAILHISFADDSILYQPLQPDKLIPYKLPRKPPVSRKEFDDYIALLQQDLLKVSLTTAKASQVFERNVAGVIVKRMHHLQRETIAWKGSEDARSRWKSVLSIVRRRGKVSRARERMGLPALPSLNLGEVIEMHDTNTKQYMDDMAQLDESRSKRLETIRRYKGEADGVSINVHTTFT